MGIFSRPLVEPLGGGRFALRLRADEREMLASIARQLRDLVDGAPDDPWLERLFPPTYTKEEDREKQEEYARLMHEDVLDRRKIQLDVLASTAALSEVDESTLLGWSQAINDLRLYLGTRLAVTEDTELEDFDEGDPDHGLYLLYGWLSFVQEHVIDALSSTL